MSDRAELLKNEGNALKSAGDLAGAAERYRRALDARPAYPPALYNLGITLRELGELAEAERCFRHLLRVEPDDVEALFNLGALLRRRARLAEAEQVMRSAAELAPGNPHLWLYLGQIGLEMYTDKSLQDAARSLRRAIELAPTLPEAHQALGSVLDADHRQDEALRAFSRAHELQPEHPGYCAALVTQKQRLCDWEGLGELQAALRRAARRDPGGEVFPFSLISIPSTAGEQLACARSFAATVSQRVQRARERLASRSERPRRPRIRLGYLSAEFHSHATAYLAAELFELHDRTRFETFAYSYGPQERSALRSRLERAFDRFVDVREASDEEAAQRIHDDAIDILVDLKGYTFRARPEILALRPAPLQVNFLGYPGTMGATFIDYLVSDAFVTPPAASADYTEKLVRMPNCYQPNDRRRRIGTPVTRRDVGLPESAFVYACFNQSYKILPEVFDIWMRLLAAVPGSVLWLLEWNAWAPRNLRAEAAKRGIDPSRLVFSPLASMEAHLARIGNADLFLDTFPVTAHTTASDAIWAGLPLLTCVGETFVSRVAGSLLRTVDAPQLIAPSLAEYEAEALRLATAPGDLRTLRAKLCAVKTQGPLFDTPAYVRDLERGYSEMWDRFAAGAATADITL